MDRPPPDDGRGRDADARATGRRRPRRRTLVDLQPLVREGRYRIGSHATRHALAEGFTESDIVGSILTGRELMRYTRDQRLLVLGYLPVSGSVRLPLHVVLEYARPRWVDVVTAFIPDDPHRVVSRARIAEAVRYDREEATRRARRNGSDSI